MNPNIKYGNSPSNDIVQQPKMNNISDDFMPWPNGQDNRTHDTDQGAVNGNCAVGDAQTGTDNAVVMGSG